MGMFKGMLRPKGQRKAGVVMHEFGKDDLHSGQSGKVVDNPKQAVGIALSEGRKAQSKKGK